MSGSSNDHTRVDTKLVCADCDGDLPDTLLKPGVVQTPCPKCGSVRQKQIVNIFEEVKVEIHDQVRMKGRNAPGTGKSGIRYDHIVGDDQRRSEGDYVHKERIIDKDGNRYRELVQDKETGEVLRDVDEKLSDHTG